MKKYTVLLITILVLIGCTENTPVTNNDMIGSWKTTSHDVSEDSTIRESIEETYYKDNQFRGTGKFELYIENESFPTLMVTYKEYGNWSVKNNQFIKKYTRYDIVTFSSKDEFMTAEEFDKEMQDSLDEPDVFDVQIQSFNEITLIENEDKVEYKLIRTK